VGADGADFDVLGQMETLAGHSDELITDEGAVEVAEFDGSLLKRTRLGEVGEFDHNWYVGWCEFSDGVPGWRSLGWCCRQPRDKFVGEDHLVEEATTQQGPFSRWCGWLMEKESDNIAGAGEAAEVSVALHGLVSNARQRADGGRVAAGLIDDEGELAMFGVECVPHGPIKIMRNELMRRKLRARNLRVRSDFREAFAVHRR